MAFCLAIVALVVGEAGAGGAAIVWWCVVAKLKDKSSAPRADNNNILSL